MSRIAAASDDLGGKSASGLLRLTYCATTEGVRVCVRPVFLEDQSDPEEGHYLWAYHVTIENQTKGELQVMGRRWRITDGGGKIHEVEGEGVVGEKPVLAPGGIFEYTSGAPLPTPSGFMDGGYEMRRTDGEKFSVRIPMFSLDSPYALSCVVH